MKIERHVQFVADVYTFHVHVWSVWYFEENGFEGGREGGRGGGFTIFEIAYLWEKYVSDLKNDRTRGNLKYHIVG